MILLVAASIINYNTNNNNNNDNKNDVKSNYYNKKPSILSGCDIIVISLVLILMRKKPASKIALSRVRLLPMIFI